MCMKFKLEYIGNLCRMHREKRGLKQSEVAEAVGCSKENISAFENGRNNSARILAWYITDGLDIRVGDGYAE